MSTVGEWPEVLVVAIPDTSSADILRRLTHAKFTGQLLLNEDQVRQAAEAAVIQRMPRFRIFRGGRNLVTRR